MLRVGCVVSDGFGESLNLTAGTFPLLGKGESTAISIWGCPLPPARVPFPPEWDQVPLCPSPLFVHRTDWHSIAGFVFKAPLFYLMAPKPKSGDAGNLDLPTRSGNVLPLSEKEKVLDLIRKEKNY